MHRKLFLALSLTTFLFTGLSAQTGFDYPKPKKVEQVDNFHGTKVSDPYRWMEDTESADMQSWIAAENKVTDAYFATIPEREKIKARLTELWNYERYSAPSKIGDYYIYSKNDGLQNQSVLYKATSIND